MWSIRFIDHVVFIVDVGLGVALGSFIYLAFETLYYKWRTKTYG